MPRYCATPIARNLTPKALVRLATGVLLLITAGATSAAPVKLCFDDVDSKPWSTPARTGLNFVMLDLVSKQTGAEFSFTSLPWKRCLEAVGAGKQDGAIAVSFTSARQQLGVFPKRNDTMPDPARRMFSESYTLYKQRPSALSWDGHAFRNLTGPIGVQFGYSIRDFVVQHGATVDDRDKEPMLLFRKLMGGSVAGIAMLTREGELFRQDPRFTQQVTAVTPPLLIKDYFLFLSKPFVSSNPDLAERLWDSVAAVRKSDVYRKAAAAAGVVEPE